jgi:signal transduction histidine kinase
MLGGDISVSGHGVRGSRFTLWLPLQTSSSPRAEESATTLVSVG